MNATTFLTTLPPSCQDVTVYLTILFAGLTCVSEWLGVSGCEHNGMLHGVFNAMKKEQGVAP